MNWPKKIDAIRSELGCTTAELTRKLGFDGHYVIDIEKGRSKNPSTKFIANLVKIGVNPMWLFFDKGDVFLSDNGQNSKAVLLENENQKLKATLDETGLSAAEAMAMLNDAFKLKRKHVEMVGKYIKTLAEKENRQGK